MTITRAEYLARTAHPTPAQVHAHRATFDEVYGRTDVPAPCGPMVVDDSTLMLRLRAQAYAASLALREAS